MDARHELNSRWRDGTTHLVFEPLKLIGRLAADPAPAQTPGITGCWLRRELANCLVPAAAAAKRERVRSRPRPSVPVDSPGRTFASGSSAQTLSSVPAAAGPLRILAVILTPAVAPRDGPAWNEFRSPAFVFTEVAERMLAGFETPAARFVVFTTRTATFAALSTASRL
jgi:hypothetical protein